MQSTRRARRLRRKCERIDRACGGASDVAPIWNSEFFGNAMVVNGATWPSLDVQQRRYRFRFLNGCNSRFLILRMDNGLPFWQIGNEGDCCPRPSSSPTWSWLPPSAPT